MRELADLMSETGSASVLEVLQFAKSAQLLRLDERFGESLNPSLAESPETISQAAPNEDEKGESAAMSAYLACPAKQLWGYHRYVDDLSPYATQQGIKGAEFERVLVILDDEEGKHFQFSYNKLLGLKDLSKTDRENISQSKDTIIERTRRLFYVCCSRAMRDLAVVLYSADVEFALTKIPATGIFEPTDIYTLEDIA